jgi:ABC-type Fe3+/spermidine/putrescine transport system ATPase subunit
MNKVRLDSAGQKPPTLAGRRLCGAGDQHPETTSVYVRPEAVEILKDSRPGPNRFTGRVIKTSFLGNLTRVEMEVAGQPIAAELRYKGASSLQAGEEVTVYFPPEAVLTIVDS